MISDERKTEIINTTKKILKEYSLPSQNVDIVNVATQLGFSVYLMKDDIDSDGVIIVNKQNKPIAEGIFNESKIIGFKKSIDRNTNRFIIAHELGHFFLHSANSKSDIFVYEYKGSNGLNNEYEEEANFFAANLLVPEERFNEALHNYKEPISSTFLVEDLANAFEVDSGCILRRFGELGKNING